MHTPRKHWLPIGAGLAVAASALGVFVGAVLAAQAAAPKNTDRPSISGTPEVGKTLSGDRGNWDNSPTAFNYWWLRCDRDGGGCASIGGAQGLKYTLASGDQGHRLRFKVEAINADGAASSRSLPTSVIAEAPGGAPPENTSAPTISGTPQEGSTLTGSAGTWNGSPTQFTVRWQRCNKNGGKCANISGATASTYVLTSADVGNTLRFRVRATNVYGKTSAASAPTPVIAKAASGSGGSGGNNSVGTCRGTGTVDVADIAPPIRLLIDKWDFNPNTVNRSTQTITAHIHIADTCNHSVNGALVWATAIPYNQVSVEQTQTGSDGYANLTFKVGTGFPANPGRQQIMAMLVRATDPNGSILAGKSTRRVLSLPVNAA